MSGLFASGRVADAILLLTLVEAVAIVLIRRRTGRGPTLPPFLANLIAGGCLVLALRIALVGEAWPWIGAALAAGGLAHVASVVLAWRARAE